MSYLEGPSNLGSQQLRTRQTGRLQYDVPTFMRLAKAAVQSSSFTNDYGKILPFQVDKLEDYIEDNSMFKGFCDFMLFRNEHLYIDSVERSSSWNLYPQSESGPNNIIRGIQTARKTFTPIDFYMAMEITDKALRINLEGDNFTDHLLQIAAKLIANDLDKIILMGNEVGVVGQDEDVPGYASNLYHILPTMSQLYGVIPLLLSNSNVLNVSPYATTWFNPIMAEAMQEMFPTNRSAFLPQSKYFCSRKAWSNYAFHLGDKGANTPFDFALYNAYMASQRKLMHVDIPIEKIPLLDNRPSFPQTFQFGTPGGTFASNYYPILPNSQVIIDNATGSTFMAPYVEGSDYAMDDDTGILTDLEGNMDLSTIYNMTYGMPGVAFLTWPFNVVLGMAYDNVEIEFERQARNNKSVMYLRISLDLLIRDYMSAVIARGLTYRNWALLSATG